MKKICLFILLFLLFPLVVNGATTGKLNCSENSVLKNESFECEVELASLNGLNSITGSISYNSSYFTLVKIEGLNSWVSNSNTSINLTPGNKTVTKVAKLFFTSKSDSPIGTSNISYTSTVITNTPTSTIKVLQTDNRLSSLGIEGYTFAFDGSKNEYKMTISAASITVNAALKDPLSNFVGDNGPRKVNLNYGENNINIVVKSQSGVINTYTLVITRPDNRDNNNNIIGLTLSNDAILTPVFNKNILSYNVSVPLDVTEIKIEAALETSAAAFVNDYGPRVVKLNVGSNKVLLQVRSEQGDIKTYTLNISRNDKNDDNYLKTLILSEGIISFNREQTEYNVNVANDVEKIEVTALAENDKSKVTITGGENLVVGENIITVLVEAENKQERKYIIRVNRISENESLEGNANLSSLIITGYHIDFKSDKLEYSIKIKKEKALDIFAYTEGDTTVYKIIGNENLKNGSVIELLVTAEDGTTQTYKIHIEKESSSVLLIIIIIIVLALGGAIAFIIIKKKKNKSIEEEQDEISEEKETEEPQNLENTIETLDLEEKTVVFTIPKDQIKDFEE